MLNSNKPKVGSLLISEPFMMDPNFQRSVLLLTQHDQEGTIGYVLNQPTSLLLSDVLHGFPEGEPFPLYFGGPVAQDSIHFIHHYPQLWDSAEAIDQNGLFWGGDFEALKQHIRLGTVKKEDIKFFIGYSGWSPGQLEEEIKDNAWMVCNDYPFELALEHHVDTLWKEALVVMGPKFAHIAQFPQNPQWN
jgi:putative transcriptional regulator